MSDSDLDPPGRPSGRRYAGAILIVAATAQLLGMTLRMPTQVAANDISRWCTVWALVERGTYAIDDCPWQEQTQDKVRKLQPPWTVAPGQERVAHFYSSKPPLLPTLIAGLVYPFRRAVGVPLDRNVKQERVPRPVRKEDRTDPKGYRVEVETPKAVDWPAYVFYLKPVVVLLNVVPFLVMLILYARLLDRQAGGDWAWLLALATAGFGTPLLSFGTTLNNHSVAASCAFFALYALVRIWDEGDRGAGRFATAGFFGALCACNELPAALFGVLLFLMLLVRHPRPTLLYFMPAAALPCLAFLATQYLATGQLKPVYAEFGGPSYNYEGSYWNEPLEMDWFDKEPEPKGIYLMHMLIGHHGLFSLTPIFLVALWGALRRLLDRDRPLRAVAALTLGLTVAMLGFYTFKTNNYGGSTNGLRWLFWLVPFWLICLPAGLEGAESRPWARGLTLAALAVSVFSIGYALRNPWSHPWMLDLLEHLNLYTLRR